MGVIHPKAWQEEHADVPTEPTSDLKLARTWEEAAEDWWDEGERNDRPSVTWAGVVIVVVGAAFGVACWVGLWRCVVWAAAHWPSW